MTIKACIKHYAKELKDVTHIPNKEVEILILHLLQQNVIWLHLNSHEEFNQENELAKLVKKRATHFPLEYLIEKASFYGENFIVKQNVLIPRPETELLVENAFNILKEIQNPKLVEVGVGSGIISVMLAKLLPTINIVAVDINEDALALAEQNAINHDVKDRIKFIKSDLLSKVQGEFDMCISNPPYIADDYKLPTNVKFEPSNALFGGSIGDELLKELIIQVDQRKIPYLLCEMGYDQKKPLEEYLKAFSCESVDFYQDYEKFDRGFTIKFKI